MPKPLPSCGAAIAETAPTRSASLGRLHPFGERSRRALAICNLAAAPANVPAAKAMLNLHSCTGFDSNQHYVYPNSVRHKPNTVPDLNLLSRLCWMSVKGNPSPRAPRQEASFLHHHQ